MGKNNYSGVEVYVTRLPHNTKFTCHNGAWEATFINEDGVPKLKGSDGSLTTIGENQKHNIYTNVEIPKEAYVYESAYIALEIEKLTEQLRSVTSELFNELINEDNRAQLQEKLSSIALAINKHGESIKTLNEKYE